jgi:hypothetical protein
MRTVRPLSTGSVGARRYAEGIAEALEIGSLKSMDTARPTCTTYSGTIYQKYKVNSATPGTAGPQAALDAANDTLNPLAQSKKAGDKAERTAEKGDYRAAGSERTKQITGLVKFGQMVEGGARAAGATIRPSTPSVTVSEAITKAPEPATAEPTAAANPPLAAPPATPPPQPRPPMMDVAEINAEASEADGWSQRNEPTRTGYAAIGSAALKQGVMGVATYSRKTGVIRLTAKDIHGDQRILFSEEIGQLTPQDLADLWSRSGGNTSTFGNLVEGRIREIISESTGQPMFDPLKESSKTGPDWMPQQILLPHEKFR